MTTQAPLRNAPPRGASRGAERIDRQRQYRLRTRRSDILVTALWSSGAAAAALFLSVGGASQFGSLAEAITSIGIVAGLIGSDFILVMLMLAARVPLVDRTIGHDRAIAVHRQLGKPALYLLLAHGVLLLIGYGATTGFDPVAWVVDMWELPDMPLAFLGLGLLIVVVFTSLVAVRRAFSYEGWHLIHLLSYAAVAVAIPHQLSNGAVLADGPQRVYWVALYVLAFGSIAAYRFAEPLISSVRHGIRVDRVVEIAPGIVSIHLRGANLDRLGAVGGQFFVWRFWAARTWWHAHPISLSAAPTATTARITIRDLGAGSRAIAKVRPGTRVWLEGPYGIFTDSARSAPAVAIIAAGIGVAPVRALLESSTLAPGEATVLLRASTDDQTWLWEEVADLADARGAACYTMIGSRSSTNPTWMPAFDQERGVTIRSVFPDLLDSDVYICGPTSWVDLVEADALRAGVPRHQIHAERFDW
jgi:predicted ferric reductase